MRKSPGGMRQAYSWMGCRPDMMGYECVKLSQYKGVNAIVAPTGSTM